MEELSPAVENRSSKIACLLKLTLGITQLTSTLKCIYIIQYEYSFLWKQINTVEGNTVNSSMRINM